MRILIVEDEIRLAEVLGEIMKENKYVVDIVNDGEEGYDYAASGIYDVIILDVMLPNMNGFDIVLKLRNNKVKTPIIMLTAKDEIGDKVRGLDCGADDYLTKPFSKEELLARVRALSRRQGEVILNELSYEDIKLDKSTNALFCNDRSIHLGLKESEILEILMCNSNRAVGKEELLEKVWGIESDAEDNNVEVYISFLRKKLNFLGSKISIEAIRKVCYHLKETKK